MKKPVGVVLMALAAVLLAAGVARAITYGDRDGDGHPYVGLVALYDDGVYKGRCSGVLVSPSIVLTAAHCIADTNADRVRVYLDPTVTDDLAAPAGGFPGTPSAHPAFSGLDALPEHQRPGCRRARSLASGLGAALCLARTGRLARRRAGLAPHGRRLRPPGCEAPRPRREEPVRRHT